MEVIIDGITYVPAQPVCANPEALEVRRFVNDLDREVSLREYLHELLATLWKEGEGFSGKRPFGNSGWDWDVYGFLVKAGVISGQIDDDGWPEDFDKKAADKMMPGLIAQAFGLAGKEAASHE